MLELFLGFFLLGSLSLAFREYSEQDSPRVEPEPFHDDFDQSVYEPSIQESSELNVTTQHIARADDLRQVFQSIAATESPAELDC